MYVDQDADDLALVNRCRAGDLGSFEALVQRDQRVLFNARQDNPRHEPFAPDLPAAGTPAGLFEPAERRRALQAAVLALPMDDRDAEGDAMIDHESDRQLSQMLDELGPADLPADFTRNVMTRIRNNHVTVHRSHSLSNRKGTAMTRKAMWGLAAAAAILLAIFVVRGFPPAGQGTESTIGAAQRYQAPQIAESDVVLGDAAVQEFIQSDTFERAIADPEVRSLLADARIASAMQDQEFRRSILDADARAALLNPDLHRLFSNPAARKAFESSEFRSVFAAELRRAEAALEAAEARGGVATASIRAGQRNTAAMRYKATEAAMRAAVETAAAKKVVDADALKRLVDDASAHVALADVGARRLIESAAARKMLADEGLRIQMARPNVAAAMNSRAFLDAVGHQVFAAALISRPRQNDLSAQ